MRMTTDSCENGATRSSRMNFSGHVEHVTIFSRMRTIIACYLVVQLRLGLGLGIGLDVVSGWLVAMHTRL